MPLTFLVILALFANAADGRRLLHQPFFPLSSPATVAPPPPPVPKYPFSSSPFFPLYPSPPPSPAGANPNPTFPANISSLVFPSSNASPHRRSNLKLILAALLAFLSLSILSAAAFFVSRRWRSLRRQCTDKAQHDGQRLFPADSIPSDGERKAPTPRRSSDFIFLGGGAGSRADPYSSGSSPSSGKLGDSPELRPLPPLSRHRSGDANCSSPEEFYSPNGSSASCRAAPKMGKSGSRSPAVSTPSYPSSGSESSPAPTSSPRQSMKSPSSRSDNTIVEESKSHKMPDNTLQPQKNSSSPCPPPPPPPPPPPAGYWENQIRKPPQGPQLLTPPRTNNFTNSTPMPVLLTTNQPTTDAKAEGIERNDETPRPKLKPLHWDKVRASSDREMVWDQLKSSSFQVNEEMMETLFTCNNSNSTPKTVNKSLVFVSPKQENRVLDAKKSQNIAIMLRALNVAKEEVCNALLEGNTDVLGSELLEALLKMAPSKEEEIKLREYKDDSLSKLDPAEKFLKAVLDVPFAFKRIDAMLYITNFDSEVDYLKKAFETLEAACDELRSSSLFLKLLEAVLKTGNRMNVGTNRGDARAFKLDTLLKLVDVKGTDGKTTLLHFVVQEIIRTEGSRLSSSHPSLSKPLLNGTQDELALKKLGLQVVSDLETELSNVKKAAAMDSDVLSSYVTKLAGGIWKVSEVSRLNDAKEPMECGQMFRKAMERFLRRAEDVIIKVQAQESVALSLVKEITEYFHGNSTKEEAHPFRIFMVVRDFLSILDQICKEIRKINERERTFVSCARQFPIPVDPRLHALRPGSSDDESSSSS